MYSLVKVTNIDGANIKKELTTYVKKYQTIQEVKNDILEYHLELTAEDLADISKEDFIYTLMDFGIDWDEFFIVDDVTGLSVEYLGEGINILDFFTK